jgi:hypothetical protein
VFHARRAILFQAFNQMVPDNIKDYLVDTVSQLLSDLHNLFFSKLGKDEHVGTSAEVNTYFDRLESDFVPLCESMIVTYATLAYWHMLSLVSDGTDFEDHEICNPYCAQWNKAVRELGARFPPTPWVQPKRGRNRKSRRSFVKE